MSHNKFICIHGHFYQPPRENAWLEVVEMQDTAAPYHDWNERINSECYAPNAAARIEDHDKTIVKIVNNYTKISFNFGPTLLSWMEKAAPETYQAILESDKISRQNFNGHGSAMAQAYNHIISPLSDAKDKETQIIWGIEDFKHRFQRMPEGMWLPETAVDTDSLELMAKHGIKFTILAPRQAKAFRKKGEEDWHPVDEHSIDTRRPYSCLLPSGKKITLFFYNGNNSRGVAFDGYLNNGKHFAQNLINSFDPYDEKPQLVHIATDGESYGHHHRHGEMALADCINHIEEHKQAKIINYGAYLELFPVEYEAQIHENSSWSCVHGVERWRSDCGCNSGGYPGWNQAWRAPLRATLDWLRDSIRPEFEKRAGLYFEDPWAVRNAYIKVILDRSEDNINNFIQTHSKREVNEEEKTTLLRLLEMQRNAMLMYTSCGWFFDEISGLETNQILQYANRAIYYAHRTSDLDLHKNFIKRLQEIPSNVYENGAGSYEEHVAPARVDLVRVGMHYAASSLFEEYPEHLEFFNFISDLRSFELLKAGTQKLAIGRITLKSRITHSIKDFGFSVLYLGQQNMIGYITTEMPDEVFDEMQEKVMRSFKNANLGNVIAHMQEYFQSERFTIWHLFKDEKRKILQQITDKSLSKIELLFREIYNDNYLLMTGISKSQIPLPRAYQDAVQFIVNQDLYRFFTENGLNIRRLNQIAEEFKKWEVKIEDPDALHLAISERLFKELITAHIEQNDTKPMEKVLKTLKVLRSIGIEPDIWKTQNLYFSLLKKFQNGEKHFPSREFEKLFLELGTQLHVKTEGQLVE
jgi:alpha-amylase/alpha-mannosidase (GH57 family)